MDEYYPWLILGHILKNRNAISRCLIERFSDPVSVFSSSMDDLCNVEGMTPDIARDIKSFRHPEEKIMDEISWIKGNSVRFIHMNHPDYPDRLKNINDPPLYFYMNGNIPLKGSISIAIVGTRRPTVYGRKAAEMFSAELTKAGFTIVSGCARGIDSIAHRAALEAGGWSIGVLGCGIDVAYPRENRGLMEEISQNGAIISEFSPGTGPEKWNFPQRNRIISGLSLGTLVVEAAEKSGSLITARFALEQGREVFAVPGNINSPYSGGTNNLIKQGAKLVENTLDIIEEFKELLTSELKHGIKSNSTQGLSLSEDEGIIYGLLGLQAKHVDQIIKESGLGTQRVIQLLPGLEIKGAIEQIAGNCYIKATL